MKPNFSVALRMDAGLPLAHLPIKIMAVPNGPTDASVAVLTCSEVQETAFGFLQLTPIAQEAFGQIPAGSALPVALYVPVGVVVWMMRSPREASPGFLQATP